MPTEVLSRYNLATVGEVEEFFAGLCWHAGRRLGDPAACRWFLSWFDETPRGQMRREPPPEVEHALADRPRRAPPGAFGALAEAVDVFLLAVNGVGSFGYATHGTALRSSNTATSLTPGTQPLHSNGGTTYCTQLLATFQLVLV